MMARHAATFAAGALAGGVATAVVAWALVVREVLRRL